MTLSTTAMDLHHILASPSAQYWLGTDELGRDVFARLLSSIGLSLSVSMGVLLCVAIFGIAFGLTSAWCGSKVDRIMMRIADIFLSIPGLLVAIAFASLMPAGALTVVVALSLTGWVGFARLSRIEALRFKQQDFMASARLSGVSVVRQLSIYILPNIAAPLLVEAAFT
ncbi:MAG: ABC transporter permease, partial [Porticoccaceae bacterium]|nr:ABC transporter permease [Porticoccaceae bacterium]